MASPALHAYLARLSDSVPSHSSLWLNTQGQAESRFFNCTLGSAFQPLRDIATASITGYEAVARGVEAVDDGLSLWRLLDGAASDDESVELDRLCRMLHAINFFRQDVSPNLDLFLSVHGRLLSAVSINHGHAFRRILDALELPARQIILQLPATNPSQRWLLNYVADNYRRNGFRIALKLKSLAQAEELLAQARPAALKVNANLIGNDGELELLLTLARAHQAQLIIKRVQTAQDLARFAHAASALGLPLHVQGEAVDPPRKAILPSHGSRSATGISIAA
jgi:EAL domain-containing protein (putative c-di-GMP-specific phosphodiesterase class I)